VAVNVVFLREKKFSQELISRVILLINLNQRNKMKKIILFISALFTMASLVIGADSAGNRADSIIMLGTTSGIHPATIIAPPTRVGILLGSDWMLGIDAGSSSYSDSSGGSKATATYTNQGLIARYFIGNSFNLLAGYHMRNYDASVTSTDSSGSATLDLKAHANVATFTIANHWLWDWGIWIGFDWLLLGNALSSKSEATVTSSGSVGDINKAKKDAEELGNLVNAISTSGGLLVMSVGFAF